MKVQLIYFTGCPHVELARAAVHEAISDHHTAQLEELDVNDDATPHWARAWGSPTVLVEGRDVAGEEPSSGCCRLYADHHPESRGVPSVELIRAALAVASTG